MFATLLSLLPVLLFGYLLVASILPDSNFLERFGLGAGIGLGIFTYLLFVAMAIGLTMSLPAAVLVVLLSLGLAAWLYRYRGAQPLFAHINKIGRTFRLPLVNQVLVAILLALMGYLVFASFDIGTHKPIRAWDALIEYDFRGRVFAQTGNLDLLNLDQYYVAHPLLTSLAHTWIYLAGAAFYLIDATQGQTVYLLSDLDPHIIYWLYYLCLLIAVYNCLRRELNLLASLTFVAMLATTPPVFNHSTIAHTNFPFGYYLSLGAIYFYLWLKERQTGDLVISGLMLGLSSWTRSGSEPFVAGAVLMLLFLSWRQKNLRALGVLLTLYLSFYLPWNLYQSFVPDHGGNRHLSKLVLQLDPARLQEILFFLWPLLTNPQKSWQTGQLIWFFFTIVFLANLPFARRPSVSMVPLLTTGWCLFVLVIEFCLFPWIVLARSGTRHLLNFLPLALYACAVNPLSLSINSYQHDQLDEKIRETLNSLFSRMRLPRLLRYNHNQPPYVVLTLLLVGCAFFIHVRLNGGYLGLVDPPEPILTIAPTLADTVSIDGPLTTPDWGMTEKNGQTVLWLGHGDQQGLRGSLWSSEKQLVQAIFEVVPGPAREDSQRTVQLTLESETGSQMAQRQFDQAAALTFIGELQPGRNDFSFKVLDEATILEQPNGDTRPLLAFLRRITVTPLDASQAGPDNYPLLTVDPSLAGAVGIDPQLRTPWPIEVHDDGSLLWLGHGDQQGIKGALWSAEKRMVKLTFDVSPGPAREDSQRAVELTLENEAGAQTERQQFDQAITLIFGVELQPGRSDFSFKSLDKATILTQPNGDTRPLLVLLRHITVASPFDRSQAGPDNYPLLTVDPSLAGAVGIDPHLKTPWPIEVYDDGSLLWLGHGDQQGIKGALWSAEKRMVKLAFDVLPGPAREDSQRTVELTLENGAGAQTERQQFGQAITLIFGVELQPGRNEFSFKSLDKATILTQPNGDTRPLLVLLRHITVASPFDASQAGPDNYPLLTVDPSLAGAVGIDPHLKTPWPIEVYEEHSLSFLWLGHGEADGVAGTLWSNAVRQIVLEFEVSPGPSREDQQRTVQLVIQHNGQATTQRETFDESVALAFPVQLQPGRNDFQFSVLDEATIPVHGDTRPLLVFLHHITIKSLSELR